ncbi:hypothetical protein N7510_001709 [Penicillium lagena]|uniref:uncharacterized protein n=1 Tax=Penicillium lagena TaxID=94218 RepID=UPI0025415516|nr:uncharacterized protein N7510_001709 [Penicillium lagena]KAJ5625400.1 hypothetical protein N7510_001709 [Penicillium lagena]
MDLAHLTRPAILCQCSRCSSSLAALENEWARLSNSYSIATAWLSVNLHRISVSSERKQIPQSSDMNLLRGRIIQEVFCKLCQQKLGVLCALDNGPNVFWKMAKVAFREIVTMRTVEPIFNNESLSKLTTPKEPTHRDRSSIQEDALVPSGPTDTTRDTSFSMQRQMQHQGRSIDQISSSVNHLQDTMMDLKHSFTSLRIEMNGPNSHIGENGAHNFDMIATVLKELKSKSEEIEKLKLEIETLKLKNRFMGGNQQNPTDTLSVVNGALPVVRSPGLLQAGRKRPWSESFPSEHTQPIADSFDEEDDILDDVSLADLPIHCSRVPLKDPHHVNGHQEQPGVASPRRQIEVGRPSDLPSVTAVNEQSAAKRPRLTQSNNESSQPNPPQKRPVGRPRKSFNQSTKPEIPRASNESVSADLTEAIEPVQPQSNPAPRGRGRPRRSTTSGSRPASPLARHNERYNAEGKDQTGRETSQTAHGGEINHQNGKAPGEEQEKGGDSPQDTPAEAAMHEKRKAKVAARDVMTRMAMQHEEMMETEGAR